MCIAHDYLSELNPTNPLTTPLIKKIKTKTLICILSLSDFTVNLERQKPNLSLFQLLTTGHPIPSSPVTSTQSIKIIKPKH